MNKFENVDIIDSLRRIMNVNTKHYKADFIYDVDKIQEAALSDNAENKRLLFMSRPSGTYCFREAEVFKKDSAAYNTWKFYGEQTSDKILAYAVRITGIDDGKIKGSLYELDYTAHFKHVIQTAVRSDIQTLHYKHGDIDMSAGKWFSAEPHPKYGDFLRCEVKPNSLRELKSVLEGERHSYEKLPSGDIDRHIENLNAAELKDRVSKMTEEEKQSHIDGVEISLDYGMTEALTKSDMDLYNALIKEHSEHKPSIRRQLAKSKDKSKPTKPKTPKKEDISL
ncbi:MAG: hypothetical protein Q4G33_08715 [bacterium]|nr:hypothetical protein [bacterium]